jgi:hypothetical protein
MRSLLIMTTASPDFCCSLTVDLSGKQVAGLRRFINWK